MPLYNDIEIGSVYEIRMDRSNGITPKNGYNDRIKYFVVLGFDNDGNVYGGVIFNSRINQNLPYEIKILHMPIKQNKYSFLRYNCFIDCSNIKTARLDSLLAGNYLGDIDDEDFNLIVETLKDSPVVSKAVLSRFGL